MSFHAMPFSNKSPSYIAIAITHIRRGSIHPISRRVEHAALPLQAHHYALSACHLSRCTGSDDDNDDHFSLFYLNDDDFSFLPNNILFCFSFVSRRKISSPRTLPHSPFCVLPRPLFHHHHPFTIIHQYESNQDGIFSLRTFDLQQFEYLQHPQNGDISVIIPGKLFAFSGPTHMSTDSRYVQRYTPGI
jgi:hypothetical protein